MIRVWDLRDEGLGLRVEGLWLMLNGLWFRVQEVRVYGIGFRYRVQGLGFRV